MVLGLHQYWPTHYISITFSWSTLFFICHMWWYISVEAVSIDGKWSHCSLFMQQNVTKNKVVLHWIPNTWPLWTTVMNENHWLVSLLSLFVSHFMYLSVLHNFCFFVIFSWMGVGYRCTRAIAVLFVFK